MTANELDLDKFQSTFESFIEELKSARGKSNAGARKLVACNFESRGIAMKPEEFDAEDVVENPGHTDLCKYCRGRIIFFRVKCIKNRRHPDGVRYHLTNSDGSKHVCPNDPSNLEEHD